MKNPQATNPASTLKASISGIRGIVGESLTPSVIIDYVSAFSTMMPDGKIIIGMDSRPTGPMIKSLVAGIFNSMGRDVVDIGLVPTPAVLFAVGSDPSFAGGIVITASHNPIEWNALKLVNQHGKFLSIKQFNELSSIYKSKNFQFVKYDKIGNLTFNNHFKNKHFNTIIKFIDKARIKRKKYKVVFDSVNGGGGPYGIEFLKNLGVKVIPINTEPTGVFAHPPEPTPANLEEISKTVIKHKADCGFAIDPDGDRLVLCDENGKVLSEELTLAIIVDHFLSIHKKSDVVINMSTSRLIEDIVEKHGVDLHRVPTGEIHVTEKLGEVNAHIGGEGNGGIIISELNKCRDSYVGMGLLLEAMACENTKLSGLTKDFISYAFIKTKFPLNNLNFSVIENKLMDKYPDVNNEDGIRIIFDKSWVLIRKSNTEPIIRIFAEAPTHEEAEKLIDTIKMECNITD